MYGPVRKRSRSGFEVADSRRVGAAYDPFDVVVVAASTGGQAAYSALLGALPPDFPLRAVCSLVITMEDGAIVEVATVGNEGMAGLPVFLGAGTIPGEAYVQVAGRALRLPAQVLRREVGRGGPLHDVLQRYTQALLIQIAQTAACNRAHTLEARGARWLLMTHDRVGTDRFPLAEELLGQMLGADRADVDAVVGALTDAGLVRYTLGVMTVLDRVGLERSACACYRSVQEEMDRLLDGP